MLKAKGDYHMTAETENTNQWCFAWFAPQVSDSGKNRAALVKGSKWKPGDLITVSFLDGDQGVQEKVKHVASQWAAPGLANLMLEFMKNTNTHIRISFKYSGSWSVIGTTCKRITDLTQPTMNFGWLDTNSTDEEVERVVLHEFGHALGLIHEHQNPGTVIHWNKPNVIRDLSGPPNNWPLNVIEQNMFEPYSKAETNFTKVDPKSIMMYPIPKSWTTNGFSAGLNDSLSTTDRKFIHQQYP
jgi:serralysin